jgi:hypothetical protein
MASIADHNADTHDDERTDRGVTVAILAVIGVLILAFGVAPSFLW